jgi:hypothetical protein
MLTRNALKGGAVAAVLVLALQPTNPSDAAETAKGIYLLGFRSNFAGYVPTPGGYVQSDTYFYEGNAGVDVTLPFGGVLASGVDATAILEIVTGTYIFPAQVLGGSIGLAVSLPFGWQEIGASATLDSPILPPLAFNVTEDDFLIGDPLVTALIGWHNGNWHWNLATSVNVPLGDWEQGRLVNLGFNRWAVDVVGSVTWLDMARGLEASSSVGLTFNGENLDRDYRTGTELHIEFAASKIFANGMSIGLAGYHYQQLTGDSGYDAVLGDFKGRVTALGPKVGLNIPLGDRLLSASLRWYHEFEAKNRLEGDAIYLTAAIPLQPDPAIAAMQAK